MPDGWDTFLGNVDRCAPEQRCLIARLSDAAEPNEQTMAMTPHYATRYRRAMERLRSLRSVGQVFLLANFMRRREMAIVGQQINRSQTNTPGLAYSRRFF